MNDFAVLADSVSKVYRVYASPWHRLGEALLRRPLHREFAALSDVTFALPRGQSLGVLGENGAGKSTLLKILAGVTVPTRGRAAVVGKIASILELASGFHPELTGRENIRLNAALLGLSEQETRRRTPDILAFAELGDFIDQPLKCYSTGMAMRLGFAIATQVEPDVLIIDEALSVGDGYFQKKCIDRLLAFVGAGGTLLFCSHAMYYVTAFCQQALWLRSGKLAAFGPAPSVVREYEGYLQTKSAAAVPDARPSGGPARLVRAEVHAGARGSAPLRTGDGVTVIVEWESDDPARLFQIGVGLNRADEVEVASFATGRDGLSPFRGRRRYHAELRLPALPLVKGEFTVYVFLLDESALHIYDRLVLPRAFAVHGEAYRFGLVELPHEWVVEQDTPRAVVAAGGTG